MGVPAGLPPLLTTRPYLTDSYVMVTRRSAGHHFTSFDDPWLRQARIGLPALGSDGANIPPALALARRGLTDHLTGFPVLGHDSPQGRLIDAVARGRIDVAFAWGPVARYYAGRSPVQLQIDTITADRRAPKDVFTFRLAAGVRPADRALRDAIQSALDAHRQEVAAILSEIDAPHAPPPPN